MYNTLFFIFTTLIRDNQTDWEFRNGHLELINKREWVHWLAMTALLLADKTYDKVNDDMDTSEIYDICYGVFQDYTALHF